MERNQRTDISISHATFVTDHEKTAAILFIDTI